MALNCYVGPVISAYIKKLDRRLKDIGYRQQLLITQSNGGIMSPEVAIAQAGRTLLSGPACAPAAGIFYGDMFDRANLITIDMGGTSFDVCLIKQRAPWMATERDVAGFYRLRLPSIDVHTIGAGGGSIAWLDSKGALHIGPQSAGADPGPVCYMRGGEEPTVTDADLLLGYLNPDYFLGGEIKLYPELSRKAIEEKIAKPRGMDVIEAARSIYAIVNANMATAISVVSVQRGEDPREYTMVAAGGAGPVRAVRLAQELKIPHIIVPRISSVFCALGSVISDLRHDFVRTVTTTTAAIDFDRINELYQEMEMEANKMLDIEGIVEGDRSFNRTMDMRYIGQFHEVEVTVPSGTLTAEHIPGIVEHFHERHETLYAYRDVVPTEIINLRLTAFGRVTKPFLREWVYGEKDASRYIKSKREVYFEETGLTLTPIYDGDQMEYGNFIEGPAIVEQKTTTIVVPPGCSLELGKYGDYLIEVPI